MFYAGNATAKAADTFLAGGSSSELAHAFDISSVAITRIYGFQLGASTALAQPLTPRLSLIGQVAGSLGKGQIRLPDGAGVLVEPITIDYTSLIAEAQVGLRQDILAAARVSGSLSANFGVKTALTATHISSPVLAIQNTGSFTDPYIGARIELFPAFANPPDHRLGFGLDFRYYRSMGQTLSASLSMGF